jgi:hypothetical protein
MNNVKATQTGNGNLGVDKGKLRIAVTSEITSYPVADATISISYTGVPENTLESAYGLKPSSFAIEVSVISSVKCPDI